ncbi:MULTISPECIES: hypothetical protein [Klebsiella pneumoniae complex]|uniref:hypothetical protein n=1 Tax=Klebsiella pneumoniae complex TaxID=3390273 RepID=UPI0007D0C2B7|nr:MULTISPECIES: hypothetical protein [Klebsiella]HBX1778632.1 hypothetical protein [Klebsiella pneumoniae subsp. pneumoniae]AXS44318.1 hypothetical protein D0896_08045 [Klebsiella pneumoniae]EIX9596863.1 hypothetical protein [Klebsiella pneumoniae]EIX9623747.1 hypothetical protein [Klebsiella pneumoniae]MBK5712187.1 hypothetical protein [Klebsiella pneumoniae]
MSRYDLIFDITYSHYVEKMFATLTGRIDRLMTFLIILSGCGVFVSITGYAWFGAFIAALSVSQVVYQFSRSSGIATEQARLYLELITDEPSLSDEELLARFKHLQNADSKPWGCLELPAQKRAAISLDRTDKNRELTKQEMFSAWLAGDLPRKNPHG